MCLIHAVVGLAMLKLRGLETLHSELALHFSMLQQLNIHFTDTMIEEYMHNTKRPGSAHKFTVPFPKISDYPRE